ncbi:MAG TPA: D-glycero-beta-D-manno-heptose 1,7-bisphosphate 7-phosphatase [Hyphomicrobiales bacterium]|nr:D-glycero-beta-D-manno-heptose 1,7-bisphosphate 7-phosphatase [Hyphomicrobiales bacterium]
MSEAAASRLVILDRDGVINEDSDDYIRSIDDWRPIPGSIEAIAQLSRAGFKVAVATNQSGIGRGYFDEYALAQMHELMHTLVEAAGGRIDALAYCPHLPTDDCTCRKPRPGLLDQLSEALQLPLAGAWLVGDTAKDMEVALSRQCRPILVLSGKGARTAATLDDFLRQHCVVLPDLGAAATYILSASP